MRATIEEGIRAELDGMSAEARGPPFFDAMQHEQASPSAPSASLADRLAYLATKPRKKP